MVYVLCFGTPPGSYLLTLLFLSPPPATLLPDNPNTFAPSPKLLCIKQASAAFPENSLASFEKVRSSQFPSFARILPGRVLTYATPSQTLKAIRDGSEGIESGNVSLK